MKKKLLAYSVGALCVGAIAYPAWKMIKEKISYHKDYQEQLDLIVELIEIERLKTRDDAISWRLNITIPEQLEYEKWDEDNEIPRVLFKARKKGEKYSNLFSMGIDGKDVKLVATYEDFGSKILPFGYFTSPNRSPSGRYIISTSHKKDYGYGCTLYDLKERVGYRFASGRCFVESWIDNEKIALVNNDGQSAELKLDSAGLVYLKDIYGYDFDDANNRFFLIDKNKKAISKIKNDNDFLASVNGVGEQIIYDMPGFKKPEKGSFLSGECNSGGVFGVSDNLFTCNYDRQNFVYNVYSTDKPKEIVGQSLGFRVIKLGSWGMQDGFIYRIIKTHEKTPLKIIKYYYEASNKYEIKVYDDLYVSQKMQEDFYKLNLSKYFPDLPTKEKYDETLIKFLYK
ncbi:hypothetical protein P0Y67_22220 [Photobacterium sp. SP02]|uniref:hypothetical protein n=1 Tax=Photobacterium sp. SP02 TaxID=3032280 RepID=UPI003145414E